MKLRELPKQYKGEGITWEVIQRNEYKALARKVEGSQSFEVFRIKTSKPHPMYENTEEYDLVELSPKSEDFGKIAWSFKHEHFARKCYDELQPLEKKTKVKL